VEDESSIAKKIEQSDVVCLVYAVDDKSSLLRMRDHWLPLIRRTAAPGKSRPVILVGNKVGPERALGWEKDRVLGWL
jgi:Ras family protein T1